MKKLQPVGRRQPVIPEILGIAVATEGLIPIGTGLIDPGNEIRLQQIVRVKDQKGIKPPETACALPRAISRLFRGSFLPAASTGERRGGERLSASPPLPCGSGMGKPAGVFKLRWTAHLNPAGRRSTHLPAGVQLEGKSR